MTPIETLLAKSKELRDAATLTTKNGTKFIIDPRDLGWVKNITWGVSMRSDLKTKKYISRHSWNKESKTSKRILLHREIFEKYNGVLPAGAKIDHVNGEPLDNRLSNLRICSQAQNLRNYRASYRNKLRRLNVEKYPNGYRVMMHMNTKQKRVHLGVYPNLEVATFARDVFAYLRDNEFNMTYTDAVSIIKFIEKVRHFDRIKEIAAEVNGK